MDSIQPMSQVVTQSLAPRRAMRSLFVIFATVALILGIVGIYRVMAYTVSQRTHEIGIRMALGAPAGEVLKLIIRQGMILSLSGVLTGLAGAFALTRVMKTLLFTVSTNDPLTFAGVAALFAFIALLSFSRLPTPDY